MRKLVLISFACILLLSLIAGEATDRAQQDTPVELSFKDYQKEFTITNDLNSGSLLTRFDDDTGCFEFLESCPGCSLGRFTDALTPYETDSNYAKFLVQVKPLCGVCTKPGFYYSKMVYSFANRPDVQHEIPLIVKCDADVVFLTNLEILSTNTEGPPADVTFNELKTSLNDWVNQLRSEGKGVWVVDLSDAGTTNNLGVKIRQGGAPLQKNEVTVARGVAAEAIKKTHELSGNKYVVIGGGVDVIPMPSLDGDAIGFVEYNKDKNPKPQLSELAKGTPLNDYCYLVNGYTGSSCYSLFQKGASEYSNGVIISRMLTEKVDYGVWPFGRLSVKRRLLDKMLKTATEYREVPQKLTIIGQHCGSFNMDSWKKYRCGSRTIDDLLRMRVPTTQDYLSPYTCDSGYLNECNVNSLLEAIGHEGILYVGSHGSGKELASTALYYKTSTFATALTLVKDPTLNDMQKMIGNNLPVFGSQRIMSYKTIENVEFNGGMHVYLGCFAGTPDYVTSLLWAGGKVDQAGEEATVDNDVAMRALYNGVAALVGCTRVGRGIVAPNLVLELVGNHETIGEAFDTFKREQGRNSDLGAYNKYKAEGRYDTLCHQLYGDPTIRLVEAS
ncbi:MAG: hypothetical protein V1834_03195 [Candidatus Micrarchaeota archaeon]